MTLPPRPERCMYGSTARVVRKAPSRWMASIFFQSANGNSSIGCTIWMPALLTSTSTPSQARTTVATAALTCSSFVTSIATPMAVPPLRTISSATACAACWFKSAIATFAPSAAKRSAISFPMPLAAPVTIATLLRSCIVEYSSGKLARARRCDGALGVDEIEDAHAIELGRSARDPARVVQRLQHVGAARGPVLAHGEARELVVLGVVLVALGAVDELHDVEAHAVGAQELRHLSRVRIVAQLRWQLGEQPQGGGGGAPARHIHVGVEAGAARVADVLLTLGDALHGLRHVTARREEVDLEHGAVTGAGLLEHVVERRVRGEPAVPVMLAVDLDRRKPGRQRAARHDMAHIEPLPGGIEINQVAGAHVDRADGNSQRGRVEALEIDQALERVLEQRRVVIADGGKRASRLQRRRRHPGCEEARHAENQRLSRREAVEPAMHVPIGRPHRLGDRRADELPKFAQPGDALAGRIAGDERGVDRADRGAGDPV